MNIYLLSGFFPCDLKKMDSFLSVIQWKALAQASPENNFIVGHTGSIHYEPASLSQPLKTFQKLLYNFYQRIYYTQHQGNWHFYADPVLQFYKFGEEEYFQRVFKAHLKILRKAQKRLGKIDVIHARFGLAVGKVAYELSQRTGIPYVITETDPNFLPQAEGYQESQEKVLTLLPVYQKAHAIVVPSLVLKEALQKLGLSNIHLISNPVPCFFLQDKPVSCPYPPFQFFTLGRYAQDKGVDILLQAIKILKDVGFLRQYLCHFNIGAYGAQHYRDLCLKMVKDFGISSCVTFLEHLDRDQVKEWHDRSHGYILPSRIDTYPNVLLEALARGKPCVATRCGGPQDLITEKNGILVEPNCPKSLAEGIGLFIKNYQDYDLDNIQGDAQALLNPKVIWSKMEDLYKSVI